VSDIPSLSYKQIISALQRLGFIVIRQKGSHIRLHKRVLDKVIKITVPAHRPINPNTLRHILKQVEVDINIFKNYL